MTAKFGLRRGELKLIQRLLSAILPNRRAWCPSSSSERLNGCLQRNNPPVMAELPPLFGDLSRVADRCAQPRPRPRAARPYLRNGRDDNRHRSEAAEGLRVAAADRLKGSGRCVGLRSTLCCNMRNATR